MIQGKARSAANGEPLARDATSHWIMGEAPFGRGWTGVRRCCACLNWLRPVLHSRVLPPIPSSLAERQRIHGTEHKEDFNVCEAL